MQQPLYIILLNACQTLPDRGGIATYTHELAHQLGEMGHFVSVLTYPERGSEIPAPAGRYTLRRFKSFDTSRLIQRGDSKSYLLSRLPLKLLGMARDTAGVLRGLPGKRQQRLLWAVTWWPEALAAYGLSKVQRIPYVVTAHGSDASLPPTIKRHFVYKKVLNEASRVFAVSAHTAECLRQCNVSPERIRVINNGVRPERFEGNGDLARHVEQTLRRFGLEGRFVLLTVARLFPRKGHLAVLEAMAGLRTRIPELHYVVVGTGSMRHTLEEKVKALSLEGLVTFAGEVSDPVRTSLLHACDVFVMANRDLRGPGGLLATEGFGIVFLEASACEKPVIAGRAGGAPEVVLDGETGFLVDPEDPRELMDAIFRLWSDRELALRLGKAGKERVRREFTWQKISLKYMRELRAILPRSGSGEADHS